ncbi:MAG: hypothetical protein A3J55_04520 [Candidatus Ryanbacteria bacterium RIFCSPHIGHO2_02_FULL_45_17b]|uniref:Uncharacterized protein n=1 Tax=Candidatus Ryanbacteria bacterium RIFCSPHIGHO2_01_FULL_45_22 TaxID=1802114 RepID=A0A1G2G2F3_9BACT|nr:MAG: hypothetical protein A2719_05095 [Candidatus Ryanbacteria bacterium RIFCSPHIGHO2_01_FULL_45_22]OGZ47608.1 MAG: hypothetical protein A3J55_04520 [Candidatus Ryanbacteria bacterium RIFCSPHIGHO2_02_FULL_45_17b]
MKYLRIISLIITFLAPFMASAAAAGAFDDVIDLLTIGLNTIIVFLFLVATVIFLFGVVRYISAGGEEDKQAEARNMIMWGIIFLAVMVAVWGFVNIVLDFVFGSEDPFDIRDSLGVPQQ